MGGSPLALYLWVHLRVRMSGAGAGSTPPGTLYRHADAARALGFSERHVRRWFQELAAGGYVTYVRRPRGLEVTITKYLTSDGKRVDIPLRADRTVPSPDPRSDSSVRPPGPRADN